MGEVEVRQLDILELDVLPDVHLRPVAEREDAEVLAVVLAPVEDVPKLGPLVLRVPLAEGIAVGEKALLGAGFLLVAAATTESSVVLAFFQSLK